MLRGVGEPLLRRRMPGLARLAGGRARGATDALDFDLINMIIDAKNRSSNLFFKEALMCGCWSIWNERNGIIFDGKYRYLNRCYSFLKSSVGMIRHRVKPSLKEGMQN
jgi:hypothetical protein